MKRRALLAGLTLLTRPAAAAEAVTLEVASASLVSDDPSGLPALRLDFNRRGRRAMAEFTARHVGQTIDVLIGGTIVTSPMIMEPIAGGSVIIRGGDLSEAALREMARRLQAGDAIVRMRTRPQR